MSEQVRYTGRFLEFREADGWEFAARRNCTGVVAVVALTASEEVLFVEQFRPPVGCVVVELPAGLVSDEPAYQNELADAAVRRELLEETGYEAGEIQRLAGGPPSAGLSSECVDIYLARDVRKVAAGGGVDGERIVTHAVPLSEVHDWLEARQRSGALVALTVYAGLCLLAGISANGRGGGGGEFVSL